MREIFAGRLMARLDAKGLNANRAFFGARHRFDSEQLPKRELHVPGNVLSYEQRGVTIAAQNSVNVRPCDLNAVGKCEPWSGCDLGYGERRPVQSCPSFVYREDFCGARATYPREVQTWKGCSFRQLRPTL